MLNDLLTLIKVNGTTKDGDGFETAESTTELDVFAEIKSVKGNEVYEAAGVGVKVDIIAKMNLDDYKHFKITASGEPEKVSYDSKEYRIYRTYILANENTIELTLTEVNHG